MLQTGPLGAEECSLAGFETIQGFSYKGLD